MAPLSYRVFHLLTNSFLIVVTTGYIILTGFISLSTKSLNSVFSLAIPLVALNSWKGTTFIQSFFVLLITCCLDSLNVSFKVSQSAPQQPMSSPDSFVCLMYLGKLAC